jgi:hypothetical protein
LLGLLISWQVRADETKGSYNRGLLENQIKYIVPAAIADSLWRYLVHQYSGQNLKKLNPAFTAQVSQENHVDEYFDDSGFSLLRQQAGLRYRLVFNGKKIASRFIQFKTSYHPVNRSIRQEFKFKVNETPDKQWQYTDHPFLRLIRAVDRHLVDSLLANAGLNTLELQPVLEITQQQQRLYLQERGNALVYISLNHISAQNPEAHFTKLELAVNEEIYTSATPSQKQQLQHVLELLQLDLTSKFSGLQLNLKTKYSNMYNLQHGHLKRPDYYNSAWLAFGLILSGLGFYLFFTRKKKAADTPEAF